jgi:hypothetical protein
MLRLRREQRTAFSEKLFDLANVAAAALVFGQFVGQQSASWRVIVAGVMAWVTLISTALWLMGDQ